MSESMHLVNCWLLNMYIDQHISKNVIQEVGISLKVCKLIY